MTKLLLKPEWVERLSSYSKLIVGFSGGLDSTVLLHLLAHSSLKSQLMAVHVNHGMSRNARSWENHCEQWCASLSIDCLTQRVQLGESNREEEARVARYAVFNSLLTPNHCLVLAHHMNDQAETLLLNLFRGAGIDGLSAMTELHPLGLSFVARPLLTYSRHQIEQYAKENELIWVEDESNWELHYSRNYIRHQIMPLVTKKWPNGVENITRTAVHCQNAKLNLQDLAIFDHQGPPDTHFLSISILNKLTDARRMNVLRFWLTNNHVRMPSTAILHRIMNEVLTARRDALPEVSWDEFQVRRYQDSLFIQRKNTLKRPALIEWSDFPLPLIIEDFFQLSVKKAKKGLVVPSNAQLFIRFRQGGEQFRWRGQTKQLKKLFQEWSIPPWLRSTIPLLYINDTLAVVVGYAVSDLFYSGDSGEAWLLTFRMIHS